MSEAPVTFDEATEIARRNDGRFWSPRMPNCKGWIHRELQNFDTAITHDREGLDVPSAGVTLPRRRPN